MPDDCVFCRIAQGAIPSHRLFEDEALVTFLDIAPIREGHVLIVTREHFLDFAALPAALAARMTDLGQRIARLQKRRYGVERAAFFFTGSDVAHAHAHVVPMVDKTDVTSRRYIAEADLTFRPPPRESDERLAALAEAFGRELRAPAA